MPEEILTPEEPATIGGVVIPLKWLQGSDKVTRSKKHEFRIAKELGGKREPRSGANRFSQWDNRTMGRDINTAQFLIEHKNTEKDSISLKKEWLEGIKKSSFAAMKNPMVVITFQKGNEKPEDWAVIPLDILKMLLKSYGE